MEYEIQLHGAAEDNGTIEFDRLTELARSIKTIARGALQIRLNGYSRLKGILPKRLQQALQIKLVSVQAQGSTILLVQCEPFGDTLAGMQGDLFNPSLLTTLPTLTPVSLFMAAFREAITNELTDDTYEWLDRPLIQDLKSFKRVFVNEGETIRFTNRGSVPELTLELDYFDRLTALEDITPESRELAITGRLDELKYSSYRLRIETEQGVINGILEPSVKPEQVSAFWGKPVTVIGKGHFKPGGKLSFVQVKQLTGATDNDQLFNRIPFSQSIDQQIEQQVKTGKGQNRLSELIGQWPGDEPFDQLINQLAD